MLYRGKDGSRFFKIERELTILSSAYAGDRGLGRGGMRNSGQNFRKR